jgi:hypothetical protein
MSNDSTFYYTIEYTLKLKKIDIKSEDVYMFYNIRVPYLKMAPVTFITLPLEVLTVTYIKEALEKTTSISDFIPFEVNINLIDKSSPDGRSYKKIKTLLNKHYLITHISLLEKVDLSKGLGNVLSVTCRLLLVNPTLYSLSTSNLFNKIYRNMHPIDALNGFKRFLEKKFDDTFISKFIYTDKYLNKFKYREMLIRAEHDLLVPKQIDTMFKLYKYPCYSFFDDFAMTKQDIKLINICLGTPHILNKFNIYEEPGIIFGLRQIRSIPLVDRNNSLRSGTVNFKIVARDANDHEKIIESITAKNTSIPVTQASGNKKDPTLTSKTKEIPTQHNIYQLFAPDSLDNAFFRFDMGSAFFKEQLLGIFEYECNNNIFGTLQFDTIYNLDSINKSDYVFAPISICNIFFKDEIKGVVLKHSARALFLKYNSEKI